MNEKGTTSKGGSNIQDVKVKTGSGVGVGIAYIPSDTHSDDHICTNCGIILPGGSALCDCHDPSSERWIVPIRTKGD